MCTSKPLTTAFFLSLALGVAPLTLLSQEESGAEGLTSPQKKSPLALEVKEGDQFLFLVTPWRHDLRSREGEEKGGPESARRERSAYHFTVKEAASSGDITIQVACRGMHQDGSRDGSSSSGAESAASREDATQGDEKDASRKEGERVATVTVGSDGCLKRAPDGAISGLPELEMHLRFILGCGLHEKDLQEGQVYPLAALYKGGAERSVGADDSNAIYVRFDGMERKQGHHKTARFAVVTRSDAAPTPSGGRSGEGSPRKGSLETSGQATAGNAQKKAIDQAEWKTVGEVVYRTTDGFLERLSLIGSLPSLRRPGASISGGTMSILRIHSTP